MAIFSKIAAVISILKGPEVGGWYIRPWMNNKPFVSLLQTGGGLFPWSQKDDYDRPFTPLELIKRYRGWVYACVNKNAINAAQQTLRLYAVKPTRATKCRFPTKSISQDRLEWLYKSPEAHKFMRMGVKVEEILQHPILDLLRSVNGFMNEFELFEQTFQHLELTGNAYWYIVRDNLGTPIELWPLLPQYVHPIVSETEFIGKYLFTVDNQKKIIIDNKDMIHNKYPNPNNPVLGKGKLEAVIISADLSMSMNVYEAALFKNNAIPDTALVLPPDAGNPGADEVKRIKSEWRKQFGGTKKSGGMAVLSGGADIKKLSLTPKDMGFLKGRRAALEEIAGIFGVPLSKLITESVNRSNAEAGDESYMRDTILPMLRRMEQKLNEQLTPQFDERLFVAYDNPVPEDKEFMLKERESNLKTGLTTINQERQRMNLEPVGWGDIPIMSMTMAPLGTASALAEPQEQPPKKIMSTIIKALPLDTATNTTDRELTLALQRFFAKQGDEIIIRLDDTMSKSVKFDAGDLVSSWFDMNKWNAELQETAFPFIRATFISGGTRAFRQLVSDRQFDVNNPNALSAMERRQGRLVDINATSVKLVRKQVAAGIEAGEGAVEIRKRVSGLFGSFERLRAERIARTETIWAHNEGAVQAYVQSGRVSGKQWVVAHDDRLCEFCRQMDGKIVSVEGDFWQKGDTQIGDLGGALNFAYEDVGHPPLHPMCRCTIVPILIGE